MLEERLACLRDAGNVLYEVCRPPIAPSLSKPAINTAQYYNCSVEELVQEAKGSAARLVNILARDFRCFRDEAPFEGRRKPVRFLKRAQIFVADVWACFGEEGYGRFHDIDKITMFADYRVPQILNSMGALYYSPKLVSAITRKEVLKSGSYLELQLRGKTFEFTGLGSKSRS